MPRTAGAKAVTAEERAEIMLLAAAGEKYRTIANALHLDTSTVAKHARSMLGYRCEPRAKRGLLSTVIWTT